MMIWPTYFSIPRTCASVAASDLRRKFKSQRLSNNNCFSPSVISKRLISGATETLSVAKSSVSETSEEPGAVSFYAAIKPIFCTETSSFKIVQYLRRIGANIKDKIVEHGETKVAFFSQAEASRKVLSGGLGAAFIWAFGGPTAGLLALGASGITIVIEDP